MVKDKSFVVVENLPKKIDLRRIGGIVKTGKVAQNLEFRTQNFKRVYEFLEEKFSGKKSKQIFGISVYPENNQTLKTLLVGAKKFLKAEGISARFVNKNFTNLSSAQSEFEVVKKKGVEILAGQAGKNFCFAELTAVQPFESYKARDYEKPARDARVGMLPPKLAQIMVNLVCSDQLAVSRNFEKNSKLQTANSKLLTVYDPFCGTGTILVEAALLGYQVLGSDIDARMVEFSKRNLEALNLKGEVFLHDATRSPLSRGQEFDIVVTEGDLGPPRKTIPEEKVRVKIFNDLRRLYTQFFAWLNCSRVVITFPVYCEQGRGKFFSSDVIIPAVEKLGWRKQGQERLVYSRPQQTVGREIVVFGNFKSQISNKIQISNIKPCLDSRLRGNYFWTPARGPG
ncbi:MAG: methyltransferase domain-containing protein [Patescibacteria group bacterium]